MPLILLPSTPVNRPLLSSRGRFLNPTLTGMGTGTTTGLGLELARRMNSPRPPIRTEKQLHTILKRKSSPITRTRRRLRLELGLAICKENQFPPKKNGEATAHHAEKKKQSNNKNEKETRTRTGIGKENHFLPKKNREATAHHAEKEKQSKNKNTNEKEKEQNENLVPKKSPPKKKKTAMDDKFDRGAFDRLFANSNWNTRKL